MTRLPQQTDGVLRVAVLGSTGSIGVNTLDVISRHPHRFEIVALAANTQVSLMLEQCARFKPRVAVMSSTEHAHQLKGLIERESLPTKVLAGAAALQDIACDERVDAVMAAIVGAAGLPPCWAAAKSGKRILLANKEALVVGGDLFVGAVRDSGATLLPIDSEHSAIFQALPSDRSSWSDQIHKIILTASGGPFRLRDPATLGQVTPQQACSHPNWVMGRKISVDSATMMNKALEVIEAHYLFGCAPQSLQVVIHPQSVIHSMVQFRDQSILAQMGTPDMRVPISYGLAWPNRMASGAAALNFNTLAALTFESVDSPDNKERFPGLQLAWQALSAPRGTCAVLNAANEEAVAAFLTEQIRFDQIHTVNAATLASVDLQRPTDLADLLALDALSRSAALSVIKKLSKF